MSYEPKGKLRPATPADLVEGNKIIVEDAKGVLIESSVLLTLSDQDTGDVFVPDDHSLDGVTLENPNTWIFDEGDFEDGLHGDYGLKLWVEEVVIRAADVTRVDIQDAKGKDLTGKLEGVRQGRLLVRVVEEHFTTAMNSYSNRLWSIEAGDFKDADVAGLAEVCGIKFLFAAGV